MIYLSGVSTAALRRHLPRHDLGLLWTPASYNPNQCVAGTAWAADNGCFTMGDRFELAPFLAWLAAFRDRSECLFATAPDVVGDARATLVRSLPVLPLLRQLGYVAAYVLQDGQENLRMPWADIDAVFVGGSTEWKLSRHAARLVYAAKERGKWAHMGRVNSYKRLARAAEMGCDSADGTYLKYGPTQNLPHLLNWLVRVGDNPVLDLNVA